MSARLLTTEEMLGVSEAWLDPSRLRPLLEGSPLLGGLLPSIERAHQDLQAVAQGSPGELGELLREALHTDQRHDRKGRGVHGVLTALAELTDPGPGSQRWLDLRGRLFPEGLEVLGQSYQAEAGYAERLGRELDDPALQVLLSVVRLPDGGTLLDEVKSLQEAGVRLGELEAQRAKLQGASQGTPKGTEGGVDRAQVVKARHGWLSVTRALEANLLVAGGLTDAERESVFEPLRAALGRSGQGAAGPVGPST
ncbi:MAG: hypothetical protein HY909_08175 [Deltaproteobacteria bacterium]|nr:hypothetical protein [Deltaproteobacteria bacterium]